MRDIIRLFFKKSIILSCLIVLFFACGCYDTTAPKEADLKTLDLSGMTARSASIVTILSSGRVDTGNDKYVTTKAYSGILLNDEGFVLTSWQVCNFDVADGGNIYPGEMTQTYAVLSDVYGDDTHYSLELIDQDEDAGLALFRFKTNFYYKTENGERQKGFPYLAEFSPYAPQTGNVCYAIGNSLGELLVNNTFFHTSYTDLQLSVTKGIVSNAEVSEIPPYTLNTETCLPAIVSAPTNPETVGGGVFDENGYLIGLVSSKLLSEKDEETSSITRMSLMLTASWLARYIDSVSTEKQTVIPYTLAKAQEDAA